MDASAPPNPYRSNPYLSDASERATVARVAAAAGPLTDAQLARIAPLLSGGAR